MNQGRLYLFTLEIETLEVGRLYNPLPAHLTLMSRFYSNKSPEEISKLVSPLFQKTKSIELVFGKPAKLGPQETEVDLIEPNNNLSNLHMQLAEILKTVGAEYTNPQFIGKAWTPHVSKRDGINFATGSRLTTSTVYLIEVEIHNNEHIRIVRKAFNL